MLVQDVMQTKLFTVTPETTLPEAVRDRPAWDPAPPRARRGPVGGHRVGGPHALAEIVQTIDAAGADISSLVTLLSGGGLKEAVIRIQTIDPGAAIRALEARGFAAREAWRG